ncbi:MAG: sensor histidine kinase [Chitinophagaceae bacterium]
MNFYFIIYYAVPNFLNKKKYFLFVMIGLVAIVVSSWMRAEVALYITSYTSKIPVNKINFRELYLKSLLNIFIWTECLVAGKLILDKIKYQRYTESIEKEKVVNELNFLKAQNNPHFLFNSLNSIYFQIDKNNKEARGSLMQLSEMLRYQLYECSAEKIPIEKEITYLKNYIELQKVRLNKNYLISFKAEPVLKNFSIAPLLIMPLIENAFKHVSNFIEKINEIKINLSFENGVLLCEINNTIEKIPAEPKDSDGGIGLKNMRRRLEILYPDNYDLKCEKNDLYYHSQLRLQIDEN